MVLLSNGFGGKKWKKCRVENKVMAQSLIVA
jgi:hypothetical protein